MDSISPGYKYATLAIVKDISPAIYNHGLLLRNPLDTLSAATAQVAQKKRAAPPRPQARPPPPKREVRYHCEFCDREGHLEEFCFRRK